MYGSHRDEEYDYSCYTCGHGYYADVGMGPITCRYCGGPINKPSDPPEDHPDDDVLLDPRYVGFDSVKAFRLLRELDLLEEAQIDVED